MQKYLTEGQQELFDSLLRYKDGTAERYKRFCLNNEIIVKPTRAKRRIVPETKICLNCGIEYRKHAHESNANYMNRRGCTKECSVAVGIRLKAERAKASFEDNFESGT